MENIVTKSDMQSCLAAAGLTLEDLKSGLTEEQMRHLDMARLVEIASNAACKEE